MKVFVAVTVLTFYVINRECTNIPSFNKSVSCFYMTELHTFSSQSNLTKGCFFFLLLLYDNILKMCVNLFMYATYLMYKKDTTNVFEILESYRNPSV